MKAQLQHALVQAGQMPCPEQQHQQLMVSLWSWHGDKAAMLGFFICKLSPAPCTWRNLILRKPVTTAATPALGCLQSSEAMVMVALSVCRVREHGWLGMHCNALQLFLTRLVLVSNQMHGWMPRNMALGGIKLLRNHPGTKTSRPMSAPDACSNLLPKVQVGNEWMLSKGAVEALLKSSVLIWF